MLSFFRFIPLLPLFFMILVGCADNQGTEPDPVNYPPGDTIDASHTFNEAASALFTPDGKGIIVAHHTEGWGREVATLYDRTTGAEIRKFVSEPPMIASFSSMAISNDGKRLVAAGVYRGMITGGPGYPGFMIWDVATGRIVHDAVNMRTSVLPTSLVFAPGDSIIIGGYKGGLIAFGDSPVLVPPYYSPEVDSTSFTGSIYGSIDQLQISPSGRYVLSNEAALWDLSTRTLVEDLGDRNEWPTATIAFRGNDRDMVSGNHDGIWLLSLDQQRPLKRFKGDYMPVDYYVEDPSVMGIAASSDGRLVAVVDDAYRVDIWDVVDGRVIARGLSGQYPEYVIFSQDNKSVMTISGEDIQTDDRVIQVWPIPGR